MGEIRKEYRDWLADKHLLTEPLGNWHSHPSSPSRPSVEDIRLAFDSKASYLILSLMADYPVLNSFHIENGEWTKEDLRIYSEEYYF